MGTKIFFTGLAIMLALPILLKFFKIDIENVDVVGAAVAVIGAVVVWFNK